MDRIHPTGAGLCYPRMNNIRMRAGSVALLHGRPPYGDPLRMDRR